jgi:hypothetical protein
MHTWSSDWKRVIIVVINYRGLTVQVQAAGGGCGHVERDRGPRGRSPSVHREGAPHPRAKPLRAAAPAAGGCAEPHCPGTVFYDVDVQAIPARYMDG